MHSQPLFEMELPDSLEIYQKIVNVDQNSTDYVSLTHNTINISELFDRVKSARFFYDNLFLYLLGNCIH